MANVSGALAGGASLKAADFLGIARALKRFRSPFFVALAQHVAHHFPNDGGNILT